MACGKWKSANEEPERVYLHNRNGSFFTTIGKWYVPKGDKCDSFIRNGKTCGFITVAAESYHSALVLCKEQGFEVAQPINRRKNIDGSNGGEKEGWHAYLIGDVNIPEHFWFNWWDGQYVHSLPSSINSFFGSESGEDSPSVRQSSTTTNTPELGTTIATDEGKNKLF